MYWKQLKSLFIHKWYVLKAGLMIGGIPLWRLLIHDWSKFMPIEFFRYARYKYGDGTNNEWSVGWLHHLHHSPHHPEYWVLSWHGDPKFYSNIGKDIAKYIAILPMSEHFVREMLADMMATSRQFGSWDISKWLNQNGPKMHLHDNTIVLIDKVMFEVGYNLTDSCSWSYETSNRVRKWTNEFTNL